MPETNTAPSTCLSAAQFRRLYQSTALANCDGLVLNKFITVAWETAGEMPAELNLECHNRLLANMRTWFYDVALSRGEQPSFACIWVRENGRKFGVHSHILVHVWPEVEVAFARWLKRAVPRIARKALGKLPDIDSGTLLHQGRNMGSCIDGQWRVFRYLMKGLDPDAVCKLSTNPHEVHLLVEFGKVRASHEGEIVGPRCGYSRQLGPAMQKVATERWGAPALWPEHRFGEFLPYDDRFLDWNRVKTSGREIAALSNF